MQPINLDREKKEILNKYRSLLRSCSDKTNKKDKKEIRKAFNFAMEAHKNIRRKSGEPYIYHPIAVAQIVAKELKGKFKKSKIIKANYFLFSGYEKIISINELSHGYHGGEFETSLMLYLDKENVRINKIKKGLLSPDYKSKNLIGYEKDVKLQWDTDNISKNGIIGNPKNASSSKGGKLVKITISTIEKIIKELKLL